MLLLDHQNGNARCLIVSFSQYNANPDGGDVTVREFCRDNPCGTYVLGLDGHVVCVEDGELLDTWDSRDKRIIYVWRKA